MDERDCNNLLGCGTSVPPELCFCRTQSGEHHGLAGLKSRMSFFVRDSEWRTPLVSGTKVPDPKMKRGII